MSGTNDLLYLLALLDMDNGTDLALWAHRQYYHEYPEGIFDLDNETNDIKDLYHHIGVRWDAFNKYHYKFVQSGDLEDQRLADYFGLLYYILMVQLARLVSHKLYEGDIRFKPYEEICSIVPSMAEGMKAEASAKAELKKPVVLETK
jgi:hypothetical protein